MGARNSVRSSADDRELVITRVFDAPRHLVFQAWTQKEHLDKWSAPKGYTLPFSEGDLRPGGRWRCCMRTADGTELWLGGVYREIVEDEDSAAVFGQMRHDALRDTSRSLQVGPVAGILPHHQPAEDVAQLTQVRGRAQHHVAIEPHRLARLLVGADDGDDGRMVSRQPREARVRRFTAALERDPHHDCHRCRIHIIQSIEVGAHDRRAVRGSDDLLQRIGYFRMTFDDQH